MPSKLRRRTVKKKPQTRTPKAASPRPEISVKDGVVAFALKPSESSLEEIFGAAFLLMDRAYVWLEGDRRRTVRVVLSPKDSRAASDLKRLAADFVRELQAQSLRWAVARNNQPIREFIAERAVDLANGRSLPDPQAEGQPPAGDELTDDQKKEIEKLISEVEDEIKTLNSKKALPDPQKLKASWEEGEFRRPEKKP